MATKAPAFANKRKDVSGGKEKFDGKSKKPRLEDKSNGKPSGTGMLYFDS